jgi:ABC-type spermidine/putrescine transport systems, ATPase components
MKPAARPAVEGMNAVAVEMRGISKAFGSTQVLKDISIDIGRGEFVTLLGPSGCGKTTSLRILAGFEQPSSGEVRVNGRSVNDLPPWRRNFGIVFQSYALFPFLTAHDNIAFGLKMRRMGPAEIDRRVKAALELVGLAGLGDRYPRQLSGGQRQRVALARALVIEPELLLLDEPLSNLDAKLRAEMRYELKRIQRESGVTTVFVTHDQEEAFSLSDKVVLMNKGLIKQAGAPRDLWESPNSAFVADFIGVENLIPGKVEGTGSTLAVRLSQDVAVHPPAVPFAAGSDVVVGLRARDMALRPLTQAPTDGETAIRAHIVDVEYRGETCAYRLVSDALPYPLVALAPSRERHETEVLAVLAQDRLMVLADDR